MKTPLIVLALMLAFGLAPSGAQTMPSAPPAKTQFIRFVQTSDGGSMLETAATTYRNKNGVSVTLIGAVHIADAEYFAGLNESFDHYDALLYEMVKPPEGRAASTAGKRRGGLAWIGAMQRFMRDTLALEFQLEAIDYNNRPNFVHADLDSETFLQMQDERNEGFLKIFIRAMAHSNSPQARQAEISLPQLLMAMKSPDRPRELKKILARQFENMESQMSILEGPKGSVILTERNKHAMNVLRTTIECGKKNIGVFYGAGHFPGMERILVEDMGFTKVGQTWRTAWDMSGAAQ